MLTISELSIRKLCLEKLGAEEYIDFTQVKDIPAKVKELTKYGAHGSIVFAATKESYALGPNVVSAENHLRHMLSALIYTTSSDLAGLWLSLGKQSVFPSSKLLHDGSTFTSHVS